MKSRVVKAHKRAQKAGARKAEKRGHLLEELVSRITPKNLHGETDWRKRAGREIW